MCVKAKQRYLGWTLWTKSLSSVKKSNNLTCHKECETAIQYSYNYMELKSVICLKAKAI